MNTIRWAQEAVGDMWRDIDVPRVSVALPPSRRNVNADEWGKMLRDARVFGTFRAVLTDGRRITLYVGETRTAEYTISEDKWPTT